MRHPRSPLTILASLVPLVPLVPLVLGLAACASDDVAEYYPPEQVRLEHVAFDPAGRLTLDYRTAAETLWHCPGADVEREGRTLVFRFRRTWFRDEEFPDAGAVRRGERDRVVVTSVGDVRRIVVAGGADAPPREVWRDGRFVGG